MIPADLTTRADAVRIEDRKPPPPQPTQNGTPAAGGLRRLSPFEARPKELQRDGCITMTARISGVNYRRSVRARALMTGQTKRAA